MYPLAPKLSIEMKIEVIWATCTKRRGYEIIVFNKKDNASEIRGDSAD